MKLNKHIVILSPGFPKDESDTTCLPAVQHFVTALSKKVERVTVVALHYPYSNDTYEWNGIGVHPLNGKNSFFKRRFTLYRDLKEVFSWIHAEFPVDIVHSFWLNETTLFGEKLATEFGLPILATAHGQDVLSENKYLKKISKTGTHFFCLSDFQQSFLKKAGINNAVTIPWGLEPIQLDLEKNVDVVFVGNLIPLKRTRYFIDLCAAYYQQQKEFRALIIGDGPLKKEIEQGIARKGMSSSIKLAGMLDHAKTLRMISHAKVLIHPARFEGFGMTMIEALALQTHVLASPVGVAMDNVHINELTMDLEKDVATLQSLLSKSAPDKVEYSIDDTVEKYLEVYSGL